MKKLAIVFYLLSNITVFGQSVAPTIHRATQDSANVKHEFLSLLIGDTLTINGMSILSILESEFVWLPYLDKELEKYPNGLLEEYKIEIYLVGWITNPIDDNYFFPDNTGVLGTYELTDDKNYVFLEPYKGVREALHHELNSVLIKLKMARDSEFKELADGYYGSFQSVSNYRHEDWNEPLTEMEKDIFLGKDSYARVDCENDMNVIASYLFVPLQSFRYKGELYNLWDFMEVYFELPVATKVFQTQYLYEKIHPKFTSEYFYEFESIHIEDIPLEYSYVVVTEHVNKE